MKKILVTGGYGNLGLWIVDHLSKNEGFEIFILARKKKEIGITHNFIECDITSLTNCKHSLAKKKFDFIIHLASSNEFFENDYSEKSILTNILGTRNLLESLDSESLQNFIYFSTFHVYGKNDGIITENSSTTPKNDYAISHLAAEEYIKFFNRTKDLPYTILRLTNSYGCPKMKSSSKWYLLLNDICKSAYENNVIQLNSNGKPQRDFIWMGDVCKIVEKILLIENENLNTTYNLSSEKAFTVIEIAEKVKEAYKYMFDKEIEITINNSDTNTYSKDLFVSSEKLKKIIDFSINENFKDEAIDIFNLLKSK